MRSSMYSQGRPCALDSIVEPRCLAHKLLTSVRSQLAHTYSQDIRERVTHSGWKRLGQSRFAGHKKDKQGRDFSVQRKAAANSVRKFDSLSAKSPSEDPLPAVEAPPQDHPPPGSRRAR